MNRSLGSKVMFAGGHRRCRVPKQAEHHSDELAPPPDDAGVGSGPKVIRSKALSWRMNLGAHGLEH
jgi:hypothetical protein